MIDNIMLLITGTLHQRQISELRSKFHPFGRFEELESSNIASTPADLYNAILVDTPLGKWLYLELITFTLYHVMQHRISRNVYQNRIWMKYILKLLGTLYLKRI